MMTHKRNGISLIEVVIATILLTLILFSLGVLIPLSQGRMRNTAKHDIAVSLADNMMEKIRALRWDDLYPEYSMTYYDSSSTKIDTDGVQFPPSPFPVTQYSLHAGEQEPGNIYKTKTQYEIRYTYAVTTNFYTFEEQPTPLAKVSVKVYWTESFSAREPFLRCVTVFSNIYGE